MSTIISSTDRLHLRYFIQDDRAVFFDYRNDERVNRYQSWNVPFTMADLEQFFTEMEHTDIQTTGSWLQIALENQDTGELVGDCAVKRSNGTAEIGITIRHDFQRRGYGKEAMMGLLDLLFVKLDTHRVIAVIDVDNTASKSLMESLGFRLEAHHLRSYWDQRVEEWRDEYVFALLNDEYEQS